MQSSALVPTAAPVSLSPRGVGGVRRQQDLSQTGRGAGSGTKTPTVITGVISQASLRKYLLFVLRVGGGGGGGDVTQRKPSAKRPSGALIGFLLKVHINQAGWVGDLGGGGGGGGSGGGRGLRPALPSYRSLIKSLSVFSGGVECCC